ncbi:MAG: 5-dehydro-4-deoxy-D-glucuronate isomerase [Ignavibacteria bacterium]|nr:5-dehydro-4-deoxy-D-glucuronate isomerase [Ignavibacteria bacterium]
MEVRYFPDDRHYQTLDTSQLRKTFMVDDLFPPGAVAMIYSDTDRAIIGSAVPTQDSLKLESSKKEMAAEYFAERREIGVFNIGEPGSIRVDGTQYPMQYKDALYIGRGSREIVFASDDPIKPAVFYFVSYPAHKEYPTTHMAFAKSTVVQLGSDKDANKRSLHKYIFTQGINSCQLVMGLTELAEGSVWNTMPSHTHIRRSEVYMYFNLDPDSFVVHLMGKPTATRNLIMRNRQVVISPSWSIHSGAGSKNYSFIWAMGGENQDFDDMDKVPMRELT